MKKLLRLALVLFALAILGGAGLTIYLGTHLVVRQIPEKSDLIILLGGNTADRAPIAARLYREGWSPKILVSGFPAECRDNAHALMLEGVPSKDIIFEDNSSTTRINALYCGRIIKSQKLHRIILVTSWYHSSRSARTFAKYLPDISIISISSVAPSSWGVNDYKHVRWEILGSFKNWMLFGVPLW